VDNPSYVKLGGGGSLVRLQKKGRWQKKRAGGESEREGRRWGGMA